MAAGASYGEAVQLEGLDELVKSWSTDDSSVRGEGTVLPSGAEVGTLHGLMSGAEAEALLALTADAPKHEGHSDTRVRNCQRLMASCPPLAALLWSRAHDALAASSHLLGATMTMADCAQFGAGADGEWLATGLNDAFRLCWYDAGGHFGPHNDASYTP